MRFLYEPRNTRPAERKNTDSGANLNPEIVLVISVCPVIVFSRSVVFYFALLRSIVSYLCLCVSFYGRPAGWR
jgi:hypothetical protein